MNTLPPNDDGNTPATTSEFHRLAASLTEIRNDTTLLSILEKSDADIAPEEFAGFIEALHQRMEEAIATAGGRAAQLPGIKAVRDTIEYFRRTAGERISVFVLATLPMNIMILREQARAGAESLDAMATSGPVWHLRLATAQTAIGHATGVYERVESIGTDPKKLFWAALSLKMLLTWLLEASKSESPDGYTDEEQYRWIIQTASALFERLWDTMPERWRSLEESVAIHQKLADARTEKPEEMKLDLLALTVGVMALSERVEAALRTMSHTDDTAREWGPNVVSIFEG